MIFIEVISFENIISSHLSSETFLSNLSSSFLHAPIYRHQNTSEQPCLQYRHLQRKIITILLPTPLLPTPSHTHHQIVRHKSLQQSPLFNLPLPSSRLNHPNSLQPLMKHHNLLSSEMFLMTLFQKIILQPMFPHPMFPCSETKTMV